jgi:stage V sporulation protein R
MADWNLSDLEEWDSRIRERVEEFGLVCYPQEFEVCDHNQMLGYMAYSGMPSHYPHWSYGKSFEKLKTLYDHGVNGLPYEMVINSNPSVAYLMRDNSLLLQILTVAHVYGHNDFFRNNFTFKTTNPEYTLAAFKARANRVRDYIEDPTIGLERVESVFDAAHALSMQCRRNLAIYKETSEEARQRVFDAAQSPVDPFRNIHARRQYVEPDLRRNPPEPDEDLLLFIRDHNPYLSEWERDLLTIAHEEAQYFLPQIETKIMNEGWASFWHQKILESLELPPELNIEFLIRHNQVVCPHPGGINPYHLGIKIWQSLDERCTENNEGRDFLFAVRESDRDNSFLRRHLTEELVRELDLFEYATQGDDVVVTEISDKEGWKTVRDSLIRNIGSNTLPVIRVVDGDYGGKRSLYLEHVHDGRDLHPEYAEKTLAFVHHLWPHEVILSTSIGGKHAELIHGDRGFSMRAA